MQPTPRGLVIYDIVGDTAVFCQICFVRVSRPATTVIYDNKEKFSIGGAKIVRRSDSDQVLVVAAGITLEETLKAADILAAKVFK